MSGVHLFEGRRDAGHGHELDRAAEAVQGGEMAVGPRRAQMGHADVLLDGPRPRDQLAVDGLEAGVRQRAFVCRRHPLQHHLLARRVVGRFAVRPLDVADLSGELRPLVHPLDELAIDAVDLRAEGSQARRLGGVGRRIGRLLGHGMGCGAAKMAARDGPPGSMHAAPANCTLKNAAVNGLGRS